jgi:hypothetical protein
MPRAPRPGWPPPDSGARSGRRGSGTRPDPRGRVGTGPETAAPSALSPEPTPTPDLTIPELSGRHYAPTNPPIYRPTP